MCGFIHADWPILHGQQCDKIGPVINGCRWIATGSARTANTSQCTGCDGAEEGIRNQASVTSPVKKKKLRLCLKNDALNSPAWLLILLDYTFDQGRYKRCRACWFCACTHHLSDALESSCWYFQVNDRLCGRVEMLRDLLHPWEGSRTHAKRFRWILPALSASFTRSFTHCKLG